MTEREQLLNDLRDLHKQATVERSHFYTGSVIERVISYLESSPLDTAIGLLRSIIEAERFEQLPGDHAISVVLVSVDEFLSKERNGR